MTRGARGGGQGGGGRREFGARAPFDPRRAMIVRMVKLRLGSGRSIVPARQNVLRNGEPLRLAVQGRDRTASLVPLVETQNRPNALFMIRVGKSFARRGRSAGRAGSNASTSNFFQRSETAHVRHRRHSRHEPVATDLVEALKRLEYRGYDFGRRRHAGERPSHAPCAPRASCAISRTSSPAEPLQGTTGIGHTRWATHGRPTEANAHPHASDGARVVHNGIIENFRELREELVRQRPCLRDRDRYRSRSPISSPRSCSDGRRPREAVPAALAQLDGAFALAFIFEGEDDLMIGARHGAPLAIGHGEGEMLSRLRRAGARALHRRRSPISRKATGSC